VVKAIERVLDRGVRDHQGPSERMRVRLSNEIALADGVTALFFGPLWAALSGQWWWAPVFWLAFVPNVAPLWWNARGRYRMARNVSIVWSSVMLAGIALSAGAGCHLELGLLVTACGTLVLLPPDEPHHRLLSTIPIGALLSVFVVRAMVPIDGLVPVDYQGAAFVLVVVATAGNLTAKVRLLLGEASERDDRLRAASQEARSASDAKSRFLAQMSHEIRTPIAGVIGLTDLMLDTALDDRQSNYAERTRASAEHLLHIVNGLLDLAKIEAGAMELHPEPFDLSQAISEAIDIVGPRARSKGLDLHVSLELPSGPWRMGDGFRLKQVLVNLLSNAVKFTEDGGVVVRVWEGDADSVHIDVDDTGLGMDAAALDRVFEPFHQADASTARRFGGTGLGLSITRSLVRLAGGDIDCSSTPGKGTTFHIRMVLPITRERPARDGGPSEEDRIPVGMRVLVAEDNPVNQLVIQSQLQALGVEATMVGDGQAALDALAHTPFDLIVMDMQMPGMDGPEATRRLRADGRAVPVCGLTANARAADLQQCLRAGMDVALAKPIDLGTLRTVLHHAAAGGLAEWGRSRGFSPSQAPTAG